MPDRPRRCLCARLPAVDSVWEVLARRNSAVRGGNAAVRSAAVSPCPADHWLLLEHPPPEPLPAGWPWPAPAHQLLLRDNGAQPAAECGGNL